MPRRRDVVITEFVVEVRPGGIAWGGLDAFLGWLLRKRPEGGFLPHARTINRLARLRQFVPAK